MNSDEIRRVLTATPNNGREGGPSFRFDRPSGGAGLDADSQRAAAESPGLIAQILKAIRPDPADRRGGFRHQAASREVWVGWWSGDEFGGVLGRARDISRGGAKIILGVKPPKKASVWLYKEVDDTLASVRGYLIGHTPSPGSRFSVRFRFVVPCPTILLQAVVCEQPGESRPSSR